MATARSTKASDKQAVCKKLVTQLKKTYATSIPKNSLGVMGTLLHGICLENRTREIADERYEALNDRFHDWNEIRVSSISEVGEVFPDGEEGEFRALRIRAALQYVFDQSVVTGEPREDPFDLEPLKRKTQDQAGKQLAKIRETTPFVRNHVLLESLGSHVVPLDDRMFAAAAWLGLVEPDVDLDTAAESLKSVLRKSDGPLFTHLLRQLANDPKPMSVFAEVSPEFEEEYDPLTAVARLPKALAGRSSRKAAKPTKKTAKKPTTTKKAKRPAKKSAKKASAARAAKTPAKKTKTKRPTAKKPPAKKTSSKRSR